MLRHIQQINSAVALTTLALLWGACTGDDANMTMVCSQLRNMACNVQNASVDYNLKISSTTYYTSQLLTITISRNSCPTFEDYLGFTEDTHKSTWNYTITATSSNQSPVGHFQVPSGSRLEIESCNNSKVLLFSTCEASPVDLPRTYNWIAPSTTAATICFKVVIQPPNGGCETVEKCITPSATHTDDPPQDLEISGDGELGSGLVDDTTAACNAKWNCSSRVYRNRTLCGSDGVLYPNRCYTKHAECLKGITITTRPAALGPCRPLATTVTTTPPSASTNFDQTCQGMNHILRKFAQPNRSLCTCTNQYKPIECEQDNQTRQVRCWCAGSSGAITSATKYTMDCGEQQAQLKCF